MFDGISIRIDGKLDPGVRMGVNRDPSPETMSLFDEGGDLFF